MPLEYGHLKLECHHGPSNDVLAYAWSLDTDLRDELQLTNSPQIRSRRVARPELPGTRRTPAAFSVFAVRMSPSSSREDGRFARGDVRFGNGEA